MAEQIYNVKCGFFDAVNNDRVYTAEDMNRLYNRVIHDGVFPDENNNPSDDLLVEADSGMTIIVGTGEGVFASHWLKNSVDILIDVPSNSSNDRIDSVVIQVDTRKSGRAGNIVYRTGEPSINSAPPQINEVQGVVEYRLANISVASGATAITSADITDLRGTSECPWVTGIVSANDIPPNSVTEAKLATDAVTTAKIKNGAVTGAKIATGTIETTNIGVGQVKTANIDGGAVTGDKIDGRTITGGKLALESVDTTELANLSVTYAKLAPDTTNYIDGHLPYAQIVQYVGGVAAPVNITYLNSLTFNRKTFYYVWFAVDVLFTGAPREWCAFLELKSDYQIVLRPNGDIYYRQYSNAQWSDFKNKALDNYSENSADYSLGFDSKGVVKASANVTGLTTGISGCKSVYTAPKCTTLTSAFKSVNPSLTDIYVDNYAENMTIDTSITNDSNITIHYRGEFKLVDLLSNSQFRLNTRVTAVETLIGDIEDLIDTELNLEEE